MRNSFYQVFAFARRLCLRRVFFPVMRNWLLAACVTFCPLPAHTYVGNVKLSSVYKLEWFTRQSRFSDSYRVADEFPLRKRRGGRF